MTTSQRFDLSDYGVPAEALPTPKRTRDQAEAQRILTAYFPFSCCVVCGLQIETCLQIAHLDQDAANNEPNNLARLCQTHHWMCDAGLYPIDVIRTLQKHWQNTKGIPQHTARMKDAGPKAAKTRLKNAAARRGGKMQQTDDDPVRAPD